MSSASDSLSTSQSDNEKSDDSFDCVRTYFQEERQKPAWHLVPELLKRELGSNTDFYQKCYSSVCMVERLDIMSQLKGHQGSVNALNFNATGNLIASGSDDLHVRIWNWALEKSQYFFSGHKGNVFQTKWLPFVEDVIATCDRMGEVRLLNLEKGVSELKVHHYDPTHKLAVHPDTPNVILSVGADAKVRSCDTRERGSEILCVVTNGKRMMPLYSIHSNPLQSHEFCVCGRSPVVKIYDRRHISKPVHEMCPKALKETRNYVTSAVYNYNGSEVLASYTPDSIYLFDAVTPKENEFLHRYTGHRNAATVKGVNFFGLKSEYIISGSDCSTIFVWEKSTEAVVQSMKGDSTGAVNCLEQHPHVPILATSGLDYDVKMWIPCRREGTVLKFLRNPIPMNSEIGTQGRPAYDPLRREAQIIFGVFLGSEGVFDDEDDDDDDEEEDQVFSNWFDDMHHLFHHSDDDDDDNQSSWATWLL